MVDADRGASALPLEASSIKALLLDRFYEQQKN
jgi:hypothetical protein